MTRKTNARLAGFTFLLGIALGIPALVLLGRATSPQGIAEKLASIAQHTTDVRIAVVLLLFSSYCALVLGVSLYAITRDEDRDLAMLALIFRVGEGVAGAISTQRWLGLVWLATATGADAPDTTTGHALGAFLLHGQGGGAMFFAVGSLLFSWLLLRGRIIPTPLARLGVVASILWVVTLPLQAAGVARGSFIQLTTWIPMAAFEIALALWLIIKGAAMPRRKDVA